LIVDAAREEKQRPYKGPRFVDFLVSDDIVSLAYQGLPVFAGRPRLRPIAQATEVLTWKREATFDPPGGASS
jgi:hypothetical protein